MIEESKEQLIVCSKHKETSDVILSHNDKPLLIVCFKCWVLMLTEQALKSDATFIAYPENFE